MSNTLQMFHKLCVPDLCTYPNLNEPEKNYKKAILFVVLKRFIYERAKNTNANSKRQKAADGFPTAGQAEKEKNKTPTMGNAAINSFSPIVCHRHAA